ncbi:MAG: squalene--hopene cyclase [Planctomycetota bacterium]
MVASLFARRRPVLLVAAACALVMLIPSQSGARQARAAESAAGGEWEITPESEAAVDRGLRWLTANQGREGNWGSNDLGLVSAGALAFLAAGHMPGIGEYGEPCRQALDYVVTNAKPSGLLNIAAAQRDMYNHGLATFVLGQAYGMTGDARVGKALDRALKLIAKTQGPVGGWAYQAVPQDGDLSLSVMQAKALRSAVDSGFEIPPSVIAKAIVNVRGHYTPQGGNPNRPEAELKKIPGQFTYGKGGGNGTVAMAAAGVVCLQEFGQYDDWRIGKSMEVVTAAIANLKPPAAHNGQMPFDAYTLNYVGQSLYQVGGPNWREHYPKLRDCLVAAQVIDPRNPANDGKWGAGAHVGDKPGDLYGTAVGVFVLSIPNRYLPILQEGRNAEAAAQVVGSASAEGPPR